MNKILIQVSYKDLAKDSYTQSRKSVPAFSPEVA
jgi:hypothetical protein